MQNQHGRGIDSFRDASSSHRGRLRQDDGTTTEFRSEMLPRYARRTKVIDEGILGIYLAGANSRRTRKALEPLLGTAHLSKSAVSRVVARLKALFESWNERDLSEEPYAILYLDGFHLKVRLARRVVSVPVLAVLGVAEDGTKVLTSLKLAVSEAASHWSGVLFGLQKRGLAAPALLVVDGHAGLRKALESWPEIQVQRCTRHYAGWRIMWMNDGEACWGWTSGAAGPHNQRLSRNAIS